MTTTAPIMTTTGQTLTGPTVPVPAPLPTAPTTDLAGSRRDSSSTREAVHTHLTSLNAVLEQLHGEADRLTRWSEALAECLVGGGRLLAAGNGGSAAEAQHLTAELVGRYDGDRRPFSAIALHADTSSLTAIANDYGYEAAYARQVVAHARRGDIVVLLSGSGRSRNLLLAAEAARAVGATSWAMTGPGPNPLAELCDDAITLPGACGHAQEGHLLALHALCCGFEEQVRVIDADHERRAALEAARDGFEGSAA
jgi:phosphoheptose isomerase